jgi:hypothetical protein
VSLCYSRDAFRRLSDLTFFSAAFQEEEFIYVPSMEEWCAPTSCLWAESTSIVDKLAIAGEYPDLKTFFVDNLQIDTPNVEMYIRELQRLEEEQENASLKRVKELISEINLREPRSEQLQPLIFAYTASQRSKGLHET